MAPDYRPMTLGNMRANGVRSLHVWCGNCRCSHQTVLDVESYPATLPSPTLDRLAELIASDDPENAEEIARLMGQDPHGD